MFRLLPCKKSAYIIGAALAVVCGGNFAFSSSSILSYLLSFPTFTDVAVSCSNCAATPPPTKTAKTPLPQLPGQRILIAMMAFGLDQLVHQEMMMDSFRDLCEAGAAVDLHIFSEAPYGIDLGDQMKTRLKCRAPPPARINVQVHLKSPEWTIQFVEFHRTLFYEHIDEYDLFIQTENDHWIRPSHVSAWLQEEHKLLELVGPDRFPDYMIGFIRYEIKPDEQGKHRSFFELPFSRLENYNYDLDIVNHPGLEGRYWRTPKISQFHHQGLFMANAIQLRAWEHRLPRCNFSVVPQQYMGKWHREFVGGGGFIFHEYYCNITQLIPLQSSEDFYIWHLTDKYIHLSGFAPRIHPMLRVHRAIANYLPLSPNPNPSLNSTTTNDTEKNIAATRNHQVITMFNDETDPSKSKDYHPNLEEYNAYVERGCSLDRTQLFNDKRISTDIIPSSNTKSSTPSSDNIPSSKKWSHSSQGHDHSGKKWSQSGDEHSQAGKRWRRNGKKWDNSRDRWSKSIERQSKSI